MWFELVMCLDYAQHKGLVLALPKLHSEQVLHALGIYQWYKIFLICLRSFSVRYLLLWELQCSYIHVWHDCLLLIQIKDVFFLFQWLLIKFIIILQLSSGLIRNSCGQNPWRALSSCWIQKVSLASFSLEGLSLCF